MDWRDINLRFKLKDGDLCVVSVDYSYSHAEYVLAVYKKGSFWDSTVLDNPDFWKEDWVVLDDVGKEFCFSGVNVFEKRKNIN